MTDPRVLAMTASGLASGASGAWLYAASRATDPRHAERLSSVWRGVGIAAVFPALLVFLYAISSKPIV